MTHCDVVFWVSNIETAFLTTHEKKEFDSIAQQLKTSSHQTGDLYSMGIVLSKYNHVDNAEVVKGRKSPKRRSAHVQNEEIMDEEEDTTLKGP